MLTKNTDNGYRDRNNRDPDSEQAPDVWLDTVTPKISIAIHSLLPVLHRQGYKTIVTAKDATQTTDLLDILEVPYQKVGKYGGTLREKLAAEQKRTLELINLFDKVGYPKVLWTHGDVSAIRTAFGMKIPIVYANDTVFAYHVARLVAPLVDWLIAPVSFGKSWSKFGIPKSRIVLYDGLEEVSWLRTKFEKPEFLEELSGRKPVILFRDAEYRASYCKATKMDTNRLLTEFTEMGTVVCLPRYEEEREKLKEIPKIWLPPKPVLTAQLIPFVDLAIGSGGTLCRETALSGIPTINFHFWDVQARYLRKKGFPIQRITNIENIIKTSRKMLQNIEKHKIDAKRALEKLKSPIPLWKRYIELSLKTKSKSA
jgi:predicted glycosyltransferase